MPAHQLCSGLWFLSYFVCPALGMYASPSHLDLFISLLCHIAVISPSQKKSFVAHPKAEFSFSRRGKKR